jgi:hypothetical protein
MKICLRLDWSRHVSSKHSYINQPARRNIMFPRRTAFLSIFIASVLLFTAQSASAQLVGTVQDVIETVGTSGKINWTTGVITAAGIGTPPTPQPNTTQGRTMAEQAAHVAAYRNLIEAVKGVRVDATKTVENFMVDREVIRNGVNGIIQGATVMDKKYMNDGSVEVTIGMRLAGALTDMLLPKNTSSMELSPQSVDVKLYTGMVVDARGLGVRPAMAPKIMNEDGKEIYGLDYVSRDFAVREGLVEYIKDPTAAQTNPRVAENPLFIKVVKVSNESRVDLTISNADAALIQDIAQKSGLLEKCRVIVLVD